MEKTIYEVLSLINSKTRKKRRSNKREKQIHSMTYQQYEEMNAKIYESQFGRPLDYNHLYSYTEKMQWAKIYDQDPRKVIYADKFAVRDYVKKTIGEKYLIPLIGVWNKYSEIDFKTFPNQFVIKTNCGSGDVTIVRNYKGLSFADKLGVKRRIEDSLSSDFSINFCERHYHFIPKRIIAEDYLQDRNGELNDYKFMCFDGKPKFVWVDVERHIQHKRNIYDLEWNLLPFSMTFPNAEDKINMPENFSEMIEIASMLSKGFSHVRVDLYNVDGNIYFGEMTFTSNAGFEVFSSYEDDARVGEMWKIDLKTNKQLVDLVYNDI